MYTTTSTQIKQVISTAKRQVLANATLQMRAETDAAIMQKMARNLIITKAALHAYALDVYKSGRYIQHPAHNTWPKWIKYAIGSVCTAKDTSMIKYSAIVLARLDDMDIRVGGHRLTSQFFFTRRLSYLHDALATLRRLDHSAQDTRLFERVILAAASMSRYELRAFIDSLNFRESERAACYRTEKGGVVTYTIVCSSEAQAEKLQPRLSLLVAMK
jgi:hypothetical protein